MSQLSIQALRTHGRGPFDLRVGEAECVVLSGPSGSGKTLLLRAVADLDAHEGVVTLDGTPCSRIDAPSWRRRVAMLPAESVWWGERVGEHLPDVAAAALEALGFAPEVLGWSIERLSSGERQRLALLRLLRNRPEALLLDEPTASLDGDNVRRVELAVADYRKRTGAAVLWVSHDEEQAGRVAGRQLRLVQGNLVER